MVLIKVILFAFAIYYILKSVMKFLLPPAFRNLEKKMREQNQGNYQRKKEGEVTIKNNIKKKDDYGKNIGEYIDFEEIKD
jgi:hypothetical protein